MCLLLRAIYCLSNPVLCRIEDNKVAFSIVEKLVLDFFLSKHEKYLSRVKEIFNSLDDDDDGVIGPEQFKEALGYLDPMNELKLDGDALLRLADPQATASITFSKYVQTLSGVKVRNGPGDQISLIQFSKLL